MATIQPNSQPNIQHKFEAAIEAKIEIVEEQTTYLFSKKNSGFQALHMDYGGNDDAWDDYFA